MNEKLTEIKEALAAATVGPWDFGVFEDGRHVIYDNTYFNRHIAEIVKDGVESEQREEDNARLIANAPEYIAYLLKLTEERGAVLERASRIIDSGMGAGILRYNPVQWFIDYHTLEKGDNQ